MDLWQQAIDLGARLDLFSPDIAERAHERLRQAKPKEMTAEAVASWVGRSPAEVNDLLALAPLVPADTPTQRLHETVLAQGGDTALARALLDGRSTPPTIPLPAGDLPTAKLGTPEAETPTVKGPSAPPRPNIPRRLGPYLLGEELGHGGMGIVFRARHEKLGSACAVKVMIAGEHASPEEIERFKVEARSVAKMGKHPNIVTVYDLDSQGSLTYYAMELVEGTSLAKLLRQREEPFTPQETAKLMEKVARAVHFAHEHGIIHRDLKPDNVVMRADGEPQVMDFGLARDVASTERMSVRGQVMGSPNYMSPEQARGDVEATDARTDVYGLGAILYEMLTGFAPHPGKALHQVLVQILRGDIVPPRRVRPDNPRDLETVCLKALALEPGRRYATAEALADDLARHLRGEPVEARPVGPIERVWRAARRHPYLSAQALFMTITACTCGGALAIPTSEPPSLNLIVTVLLVACGIGLIATIGWLAVLRDTRHALLGILSWSEGAYRVLAILGGLVCTVGTLGPWRHGDSNQVFDFFPEPIHGVESLEGVCVAVASLVIISVALTPSHRSLSSWHWALATAVSVVSIGAAILASRVAWATTQAHASELAWATRLPVWGGFPNDNREGATMSAFGALLAVAAGVGRLLFCRTRGRPVRIPTPH